ncbi:kinase-like domain-containing protein [Pseudoneurospora amorphoporcata]|uniref:non-specific serine/threonine protein kinase n=1 Tax=Pseudoneurospora amorphoporcata TaxID=241081 RepID=A0AAN6NU28_9PEZI|nr:kinase-like domain-containing protein [Pseudoneurospora amorphoporcata]
MSLIPYHPREGREIVLRHRNAIVVRDPLTQRLEIRGLQLHECPTCHQPLRTSPESHVDDDSDRRESYVDPDYFRMLRDGHNGQDSSNPRPPSSPIRRLVRPVPAIDDRGNEVGVQNAEFVSSEPVPPETTRIKKEAFAPNYFETFFHEERTLGRGGKGVVMLVRHEIDGCNLGHFACKRVPVGDDHAWLGKVLVEVELLAKLSHPNLVSYRFSWVEDVKINKFGPKVACAFILQQYCNGGDLQNYVIGDLLKEPTIEEIKAQRRRRSKGFIERPTLTQRQLPFKEIFSLFKDITSGLAYLHAANYIHRDLKPSNCLLHREGGRTSCLISDFGEVQPENAARLSTGSTGTISYCAPEVLIKDANGKYGNFTTKSDIFSLGMILYFMCFGRLPYANANSLHEELEDIDLLRSEITDWKGFEDERRERPELPAQLYQLLKRLLAINPAERPSANEVLSAMKNESSLDGLGSPSTGSAPSIGLAGRRIQDLDSPMPPSTPVPGQSPVPSSPDTPPLTTPPQTDHRHAKVSSSPDEDLPWSVDGHSPVSDTHQNGASDHRPHHTRTQSQSLTLSRSRDHVSSSPEPRTPMFGLGQVSRSGSAVSPQPSPPAITPPLLMPPPSTRLEQMKHRAVLTQYHAGRWLEANGLPLGVLLRLALLGIKIFSLSWTCWPYASNLSILTSIFALAILDLLNPVGIPEPRRGSNALLGVSPGSRRASSNEQLNNQDNQLDDHDGHIVMATPDSALAYNNEQYWRAGTIAGWKTSASLLLLHFAILWATNHMGLLCAVQAGHGRWSHWPPPDLPHDEIV